MIRNIIFDLGAVIMDIDYNLTEIAFMALGVREFNYIYSKKKQQRFFDRFETGEMSAGEFRNELRKHLQEGTNDKQIDEAWNAMLIGIPAARYQWLNRINKEYNIYLLSNTNTIHVDAFSKMIDMDYGIQRFETLFRNVYYSCRIGMRKPDTEIFEFVLNDNHLLKDETIFIDDSLQHVEGAVKSGLVAWHLADNQTIEQLLAAKTLFV